jgi:3-oxoacyl-[acyl-carrier protein] reductase
MRLKGRVALITGAGQGIGRAIALKCQEEGARVAIAERNPETGNQTAGEIKERGGECLVFKVDVAREEEVSAMAREIHQHFGRLDILVNNAGFDRPGGALKISLEDWDAVMGVHLRGALITVRAVLPFMQEAGYGRIINISSVYGKAGGKGELAYCAAKAGVMGFTKSLAREVGKFGITVNAVLPGLTNTPTIQTFMAEKYKAQIIADTPLGRIGRPEEIAAPVVFLASEEAGFITGACLEVSGGWLM